MQRRSLIATFAALLGFAATARAERNHAPEDVMLGVGARGDLGTLLYVRFTDTGAEVRPGQVAPLGGRDLLVVPPNPDEWTESKARALDLGERVLAHIQHLHDSGKLVA